MSVTERVGMASELADGYRGRLESTISLKIVEAKNLPPVHEIHGLCQSRDTFVVVALDQEEIFRTATAEKSLSPFYAEEYTFLVPHDFSRLCFYMCVSDIFVLNRDTRLGKVAIPYPSLKAGPQLDEQWFPIHTIDADSEVQGKVHISLSVVEKLVAEGDTAKSQLVLVVRVLECCGLSAWGASGFSDPYCQVLLLASKQGLRSEIKRGAPRKKTLDPKFNESFEFPITNVVDLGDAIVRVSVWHQHTLLTEDVFLGHVNLALTNLDTSRTHAGWYQLCQRQGGGQTPKPDIGSLRIRVCYSEDYIFPLTVYTPLQTSLLKTLTCQDMNDSAIHILAEVFRDRSAMARSMVKIFLSFDKLEQLLRTLIQHEVDNTVDPNTLFRGNSVASKMIDEFMKLIGRPYLQRTLQCCIDEIFDARKHCEIDQAKLADGDNYDVNMANLLFFIEKILSAITASARSCPRLMCRLFAMLREAAVRKFPEKREVVQYTAVSGFIFLRFFAPAILNPKLFQLRPEYPSPVVGRTLTLISKSIQSLGNNITSKQMSGSLQHKESYMTKLNMELTDNIKDIREYLTAISDPRGGQECPLKDMVYREGFLIKRSQGRKRGPKNFRKRYFCLTSSSLTYAKSKGDSPLCVIPSPELLAVERVDDNAFAMRFMFQLVQPERILYMQAKNSVEQMEWLMSLSKVCARSERELYHSGAYLNSAWTCCGGPTDDITQGCKPISLAVRMLANTDDIDLERELHKVYRMFLQSQSALMKLKQDASSRAHKNDQADGVAIPTRIAMLCELLVFTKNLELTSIAELSYKPPPPGSKNAPYRCASGEAYVPR